jgi:hypothetical protein
MCAQFRIQAFKMVRSVVAGGGEFVLEIKVAVENPRHTDSSFPADERVQARRGD